MLWFKNFEFAATDETDGVSKNVKPAFSCHLHTLKMKAVKAGSDWREFRNEFYRFIGSVEEG